MVCTLKLAVLPAAMKGRKDVVGAAETGSGKTLAFGIPILYGIMKDKEFEQKKMNQEIEGNDNSDPSSDKESDNMQINEEEGDDEPETLEGEMGGVQVIDVVNLKCVPPKNVKGKKKLRALIITPTRELAVQIEKHLRAVAKYTDISIALVIGGMAAPKQERLLSKGPDIVIGTPGRLWEMIEGGNPHLSQVNDIR